MPYLMKGHKWKERAHKMTYPCVVEAKVDEIRLHVKRVSFGSVQFESYAEKPLHNLSQFADPLLRLMIDFNITNGLDLGVWVNRNFADTYSYTRSSSGVPERLLDAKVEFILFDVPEWGSRYKERRDALDAAARAARINHGLKMIRPHFRIATVPDQVLGFYKEFREDGYEGAMAKSFDHVYKVGKRIDGWLKVKPSEDADGVITALHEAHATVDQPELGIKAGDPLGRIGSVTVRVTEDDGTVSYATPSGINHTLGVELYLNPQAYLGEWCEFSYMERDRQGGYRHPVFHRIREAK